MDWKDIGIRAVKTAIQTAIALLAAINIDMIDLSVIQSIALSSASAGLSVIWNAFVQYFELSFDGIQEERNEIDEGAK